MKSRVRVCEQYGIIEEGIMGKYLDRKTRERKTRNTTILKAITSAFESFNPHIDTRTHSHSGYSYARQTAQNERREEVILVSIELSECMYTLRAFGV